MQYTVNQLYDVLHQTVYSVYDVFKNFFGEEYVDLQLHNKYSTSRIVTSKLRELEVDVVSTPNYDVPYELSDTTLEALKEKCCYVKSTIIVWWPTVRVTNENEKSITIKDLYAKIEIQPDGRIPYENRGFLLGRATYTKEQFISGYLHSHIEGIPKTNLATFLPPCLGSGPIRETIVTLKNESNEVTWMLFCQELAMYVTIESIAGVPWRRLENVGGKKIMVSHNGYTDYDSMTPFIRTGLSNNVLKDFIAYYLKNGHLSLSFKEGKFCCGMPYYEFIIDISNAFIDFFNSNINVPQHLLESYFSKELLFRTIAANGVFYKARDRDDFVRNSNVNLDLYRNQKVLTFKGKEIRSTITEDTQASIDDITESIIISHKLAMYILHHILRIINYRYINEYYLNKYRINENTPNYKGIIYI